MQPEGRICTLELHLLKPFTFEQNEVMMFNLSFLCVPERLWNLGLILNTYKRIYCVTFMGMGEDDSSLCFILMSSDSVSFLCPFDFLTVLSCCPAAVYHPLRPLPARVETRPQPCSFSQLMGFTSRGTEKQFVLMVIGAFWVFLFLFFKLKYQFLC